MGTAALRHHVGQRIFELRHARGWTQVELAEKAAVSQPYLSRLERGVLVNPAAGVVHRLARSLGVPVSHLYAQPGSELLALRADLHVRVTRALADAGGDLDRAEAAARRVLAEFLDGLGELSGREELEEWGFRLIHSHLSLRRLSMAEAQSRPQAQIPLAGRYGEDDGGGGRLAMTAELGPRLPPDLRALVLGQRSLVPGGDRGDVVLYSPGQTPESGDLALVEFDGSPHVRRVFFEADGVVDLVHPVSAVRPRRLAAGEVTILGRILGLVFHPRNDS